MNETHPQKAAAAANDNNNSNYKNLRTAELEETLYIIEPSPFHRGTKGNLAPNLWHLRPSSK